ncbi:MAG: 1-acyl-sn-glycerol-3-phosphate acyltransferase, partial [Saprospiraceae bacterium]
IVVSNHPSTLMDVLNVGEPVPKAMFFLANYGLFKNPVSNWILTRLFCIPIKRKEDVAEGDSRNNDSAFEQSFQHLEKQGILFIAPEGYSWMNRWVREFKTGTARIAFGAESRNNWQLGLKIYPVGLTYSAPNLFRSQVVINYGEPVSVAAWESAWRQHRAKAVDALTNELQQQVTGLTVHTRDEAGQQLIAGLDEILANRHPLPPIETFQRSQQLANRYLDHAALSAQVEDYFANLRAAHLRDIGLEQCGRRLSVAPTVLGFPFFALGYAFWWLPCFLPWLLTRSLGLYVGYASTLKVLAGAIVIPLWLWGAYRMLLHFSGSGAIALLVLVLCVGLAFIAEPYLDVFQPFRQQQKAALFALRHPATWRELSGKREAILQAVSENNKN